jgi:predicted permease
MHDIRFALRHLTKHWRFTLIVMLTLGLGIGLVATQFSLIDGVLLRPLPFANADRLMHVSLAPDDDTAGWRPLPMSLFTAVRDQAVHSDSLEGAAAFSFDFFNLSQNGASPRRMTGRSVSSNFFDLIQVKPAMGRGFRDGEDRPGQPMQVVLAHRIWVDEFGSDPGLLGRSVRINGEMATVIGVMPPGFGFPLDDDCWANLRIPTIPTLAPGQPSPTTEVLAVLKPGVSSATATAELSTLARAALQVQTGKVPEAGSEPRAQLQSFQAAYSGSGTAVLLTTMLAMTLFVLAVACVNVANLLFVRGSDRLNELAVRATLGAERGRLVRQLLVESVLLSGLGALVGAALAAIGVHWLQAETSARLNGPSWMHFQLDARVLAFTAGIALLSGLAAGLLPAVRMSRMDLNSVLRASGRGGIGSERAWLKRSIVVGQLGFACAAMVVAALLALSAVRSTERTLAFDPQSMLVGRIELQGLDYVETGQRSRFYNQLIERVRQVPGVAAAAVSSRDLVNPGVYADVEIDGRTPQRAQDRTGAWLEVVSRDYFSLVDLPARSGRLFSTSDTAESTPVALVNESFARRHWPGKSALGERVRRQEEGAPWATVIGVVADLNMEGINNTGSSAGWYLLQDQMAWGWLDLLVRAQGDPRPLIAPLRNAVAAIDPDQPIHTIGTLAERTARGMAAPQIIGSMASIFALTALLLVAVGIYGVTAFAAQKRTRELGLRMALGASAGTVTGLLVRQNLGQSLAGIGSGLLLGYALALPLGPILPAISINEPGIYLAVALILITSAVLASWLPARRAAAQDPLESMRG